MKHRTTCRLCDSTQLSVVLDIKPTPIADAFVGKERIHEAQASYPLTTYICGACGHVQNLDIVEPEILFRDYTYQTSVSLGLVEHFKNYAKSVVTALDVAPHSLVVEIGSNDGSLLQAFATQGMRVLGIDPARNIARDATARGTETLPEFFSSALAETIAAERGPAAVVCANNVFAHIDDMSDIVRGIRTLLAPDGVFVFEASYVIDMVDNLTFDTIYHEHVSHHALAPLAKFFERFDLQLFDTERIVTKGGSIRGFVQRRDTGARAVTPRLQTLIANEHAHGMLTPAPYRELFAKIERRKAETLRIVNEAVAAGHRIAAYGASTTTTTLLYHFELEHLVSAIFDDNAIKHGTYSPGAHIPVYASEAIYEQRPDLILILAWMYAGPIVARHQRYLDEGGSFVIPLPDVQLRTATVRDASLA